MQCRDLYDLYRLTKDAELAITDIRPVFERKTRAKNLDPGAFPQRFDDRIAKYAQRWSTEMNEHVADPPRFEEVARVVRRHLRTAGPLDT